MRVATRRIISRRLDAIPTEDGQLLLKLKRKKKGVCVKNIEIGLLRRGHNVLGIKNDMKF